MSRTTANLLLLFAAAIWGSSFVPQQTAMGSVSPMWFLAARYALTLVVLAPFVWREHRRARPIAPKALGLMILIGAVFVGGNALQQVALLSTSITNAGFLTSLYLVFTPFVAMALTRERPGVAVWPSTLLGLGGAWLLSGGLDGSFSLGDGMITASAVLWAVQIVLIGLVMRACDRPLLLVVIQGGMLLVASGGWAIGHDPISVGALVAAGPEIVYTGLLSGVVAYTIQAVAQRHTEASDAAVIYASEAPFASLAGWVMLGERLSSGQWAGAAAIFAAVSASTNLRSTRATFPTSCASCTAMVRVRLATPPLAAV